MEKEMNTIKKIHITRFKKLAAKLDMLMAEILEYCPTAELYAEDSWNLNLMNGPSHEGIECKAQRQRVVQHAYVRKLSGGGW